MPWPANGPTCIFFQTLRPLPKSFSTGVNNSGNLLPHRYPKYKGNSYLYDTKAIIQSLSGHSLSTSELQTLLIVIKIFISFLKVQLWALEESIQWTVHLPHRYQAAGLGNGLLKGCLCKMKKGHMDPLQDVHYWLGLWLNSQPLVVSTNLHMYSLSIAFIGYKGKHL